MNLSGFDNLKNPALFDAKQIGGLFDCQHRFATIRTSCLLVCLTNRHTFYLLNKTPYRLVRGFFSKAVSFVLSSIGICIASTISSKIKQIVASDFISKCLGTTAGNR